MCMVVVLYFLDYQLEYYHLLSHLENKMKKGIIVIELGIVLAALAALCGIACLLSCVF